MGRGIRDPRVLEAMRSIPRHLFVGEDLRDRAYDDSALSIGCSQTISQPYMVAIMTEALELKGSEKVLEVGTGSGYQTAILSRLAREVFTIERIESLALGAREALDRVHARNVTVCVGDGSMGMVRESPFDAILVTAGSPRVPPSLLDQLKPGGRLVIPIGDRSRQSLHRIVKRADRIEDEELIGCVFVPLIGEEGWRTEAQGENGRLGE